eukprot:Gb_21190 [translate_table: standard]
MLAKAKDRLDQHIGGRVKAAMDESEAAKHRWWSEKTVAVVTGANKGIGYEIVRQLASNGIQDPTSIAVFAEWIKQQYGKLDILVNNAAALGISIDADVLKAKEVDPKQIFTTTPIKVEGISEDYEAAKTCIDIAYYGAKRTTEALLPLLKLSDAGARIVNISSSAGLVKLRKFDLSFPSVTLRQQLSDLDNLSEEKLETFIYNFLEDFRQGLIESHGWPTKFSAYFISKAALNAYTRILARRYPSICVNSVHPGYVKTDMNFNSGVLSIEEGAEAPVMVALLPPGGPSDQVNLTSILDQFPRFIDEVEWYLVSGMHQEGANRNNNEAVTNVGVSPSNHLEATSVGTMPVNMLLPKFKYVNSVSWPTSGGMVPVDALKLCAVGQRCRDGTREIIEGKVQDAYRTQLPQLRGDGIGEPIVVEIEGS